MTRTDHPLSETRATELWDAHRTEPGVLPLHAQGRLYIKAQVSMLRAAYDAGREDALKPLDPLADLTPGAVIRDVEASNDDHTTACVMGRDGILYGDWHGGGGLDPHCIDAFTTDDRRTRWTCTGGTWTTETLNGETND